MILESQLDIQEVNQIQNRAHVLHLDNMFIQVGNHEIELPDSSELDRASDYGPYECVLYTSKRKKAKKIKVYPDIVLTREDLDILSTKEFNAVHEGTKAGKSGYSISGDSPGTVDFDSRCFSILKKYIIGDEVFQILAFAPPSGKNDSFSAIVVGNKYLGTFSVPLEKLGSEYQTSPRSVHWFDEGIDPNKGSKKSLSVNEKVVYLGNTFSVLGFIEEDYSLMAVLQNENGVVIKEAPKYIKNSNRVLLGLKS